MEGRYIWRSIRLARKIQPTRIIRPDYRDTFSMYLSPCPTDRAAAIFYWGRLLAHLAIRQSQTEQLTIIPNNQGDLTFSSELNLLFIENFNNEMSFKFHITDMVWRNFFYNSIKFKLIQYHHYKWNAFNVDFLGPVVSLKIFFQIRTDSE